MTLLGLANMGANAGVGMDLLSVLRMRRCMTTHNSLPAPGPQTTLNFARRSHAKVSPRDTTHYNGLGTQTTAWKPTHSVCSCAQLHTCCRPSLLFSLPPSSTMGKGTLRAPVVGGVLHLGFSSMGHTSWFVEPHNRRINRWWARTHRQCASYVSISQCLVSSCRW